MADLSIRVLINKQLTHSSILTWKIPWAEEPGGLQCMGSQRVGHDWATEQQLTLLCLNRRTMYKRLLVTHRLSGRVREGGLRLCSREPWSSHRFDPTASGSRYWELSLPCRLWGLHAPYRAPPPSQRCRSVWQLLPCFLLFDLSFKLLHPTSRAQVTCLCLSCRSDLGNWVLISIPVRQRPNRGLFP